MAERRACPKCGALLPANAPAGICPSCLMQAGLDDEAPRAPIDATAPVGRFVPPKPDELAGHFPQLEVLELLGQGGMGAVYKARQAGLDRFVALKILASDAALDPAFAARFLREAKSLAKLNHPNIVAVYDFGQHEGLYYFIMEFVDGLNLRQVIRSGQCQPNEALRIVPQICEALQFAHDEGIVHRDIKPENILLDKRGRLKIADFGLARLHTQTDYTLTGPWQVMGTPHYMAPEQLERPLTVDHRADIYSLGVVFYELLTGELPLGRFAPPSEKVSIDARLDDVVLRSLEKEPQRRYQQAGDVKTDVETILHSPAATVAEATRSVAVLPLVNAGGDPSAAYFCEGIADQLINSLSQLRRADLKVRPFAAVAAYHGQVVNARTVGRDLNVQVVVTGRLYLEADDLSISVALVKARDNSQLWGQQYHGKRSDILALQVQMAQDVAASLRLDLTSEEEQRLTRRDTHDVDAYLLYREGMHHWNKFTEERTRTAIEYFERALAKDPRYAMAYAGLAQCYAQLGNLYLPPHEGYPKAKEALAKALALDETIVQVHVMLAFIALSYDWNWAETEQHLHRATHLDPSYAAVHGVRAGYLAAMGRLGEAIGERMRAKELEPTAFRGLGLAGAYLLAGQYEDAVAEARQTLLRADRFFLARGVLGLGLALQGNHDEALAELQTASAHANGHPQILGYLGVAYAIAGRAENARSILDELMQIPRRLPGFAFHVAAIHTGLGNHDEAFQWLQAASAERYVTMIFLRFDPLFEPLRGDPRFRQLLIEIGLSRDDSGQSDCGSLLE